jgi:cytochrome c peroxidase
MRIAPARGMKRRRYPRGAPYLLAAALLLVCSSTLARSSSESSGRLSVTPDSIPAGTETSKVALGRLLFHDPRLSRNRDVSCSTCHALTKFGADGRSISLGAGGARGRRNAPSVFNAATHFAQFWDGRAVDVETLAVSQILNPVEMAMPSEKAVVRVLGRVPSYVELFQKAFPGHTRAISLQHVGEAIGAFVRGLVTESRWDRFVAGEASALTPHEMEGLRVFRRLGCVVCHAGPQVGGTSFQKLGTVFPWPTQSDQGRVEITKEPLDRMVFKVPSLKNVAETAPYFHDGSTSSLEAAIKLMGRHQLGIELADDEIRQIGEWMRSMTGKPDLVYVAPPPLPPG